MKALAEYLAEYIETEMDRQGFEYSSYIKEWIEQGIEAYQSTENCSIDICGGDCPDCGTLLDKKDDSTFDGTGNHIECFKYECSKCGYEIYC